MEKGRKLNVHKKIRRRLRCLLKILSMFNLRPAVRGRQVHSYKTPFMALSVHWCDNFKFPLFIGVL